MTSPLNYVVPSAAFQVAAQGNDWASLYVTTHHRLNGKTPIYKKNSLPLRRGNGKCIVEMLGRRLIRSHINLNNCKL